MTLFVGSLVIYGAMFMAPGDPATLLAGNSRPSPEALAAIRSEFNLDQPFWRGYANWVGSAVQGDFGTSLSNRTEVRELVVSRLPITLQLVAYAALLVLVCGLLLGVVAAWRGGATATAVTSVTTVLMASPTFVVAVLLIAVFATGLGWFPVFGAGEGSLTRLWHLTLPAVALSFAWLAYVAQVCHEALRREFLSEHVMTAHARGTAPLEIVRKHVVLNASAPLVTVGGLALAGIFASTAIAEQAFGIQGIGSLLVQSAARQDIAVVQAISLILIATFVVINTVVDVMTAALDPRVRAGGMS